MNKKPLVVEGASSTYQLAVENCGLPKGYKQTEVGVIPVDWITQTIFQTSRKIQDYRGRTPKKLGMDWGGGDIPALSAGNVKMGFIDFNEECYLASEALYKRWMINGDIEQYDIVFTMEAPLGNVALIPDNRKYILSQRTVLLQTNSEKTFSQFLYHVLMSQWFQRQLVENATGSTAQGIQRKKFEKLFVICPPLNEQTAIATALSDVDALLAKLDQLISKKRDLKQATMQQLLTGQTRLPEFSSNTKYKKTEVGLIPEDWDVSTLGSHVEINSGESPSRFRFETSGVPYFKVDQLNNDSKYLSATPYFILKSKIVLSGSLIFPKRGASILLNKVRILYNDSFMDTNLMTLTPRSSINNEFLYYLLTYIELWRVADTTSIPQINNKHIIPLFIQSPSLPEQTAIATILSDMDAEIKALEACRDKTRDLKQGMMQELLTGRIRLI